MSETANLLLNSLSTESRAWLLARCTSVPLPIRTVLYAAERRPTYGYFITSGMASVVTSMTNGGTAEVGVIGREGLVGSLHLLGPASISTDCFIQIKASALRIRYTDLEYAFRTFDDLRQRALEFVQEQIVSLGQVAGCNRLHSAEERLARWLLAVEDRTQSDAFSITQEFLSQMLGSKRTTVTVVAAAMQQDGLITYSRGNIRIVDRTGLEEASCECYKVTRTLYRCLYSSPLATEDHDRNAAR